MPGSTFETFNDLPNNPGRALANHGLKTNSSSVDARLSKMEASIENIAFLAAAGNLVVNQLLECEAAIVVTTKAVSTEEPKWTTTMAKNVR